MKLVIERNPNGQWPDWALKVISGYTMHFSQIILDDLADTQPGVLCPTGCGCRVGTDDADATECACDGPCCWVEKA